MKIHLITGATGFVGRYLTRALLESGAQVWVVVRPDASATMQQRVSDIFQDCINKYPTKLRAVEGDILHKDLGITKTILQELDRHEVIIWHLAANLSFSAKNQAEVQKTNYDGTINATALANKIAAQFFHMSTAYVCGSVSSMSENELNKGQRFRNQYEKSKFRAEQHVQHNCRVPYIIFRPSIIIGDAYRGKAEGCTFGYYRYMFVFHFLKQQIVKALQRQNIWGLFFRKTKTSFDSNKDILTVPWLVLPYPRNARVDLIPVDYIVSSMINLYKSSIRGKVVHLTQKHLPQFNFLLKALLYDLGYRRVVFVPVPSWVFRCLVRCLYLVAVPLRKYIRSIMWYTPYFTQHCRFEQKVGRDLLPHPPVISRLLIKKVNRTAKKEFLDHITV